MPHRRIPALGICLKLPPRPSITPDFPLQYQPPPRSQPAFDESSTCHYVEQVYEYCHSPYATTVPPQVRHISLCPYAHQPLSSNVQPKLICLNLRGKPMIVEILTMCDPCILKLEGPGVAVIPLPRASFHGNFGEGKVGLEGEWVLVYKKTECGGVEKERWIRIQAKKLWRVWQAGKRTKGEVGESEIVIWIDGEEWTVVR